MASHRYCSTCATVLGPIAPARRPPRAPAPQLSSTEAFPALPQGRGKDKAKGKDKDKDKAKDKTTGSVPHDDPDALAVSTLLKKKKELIHMPGMESVIKELDAAIAKAIDKRDT